MAIYKTYLIPRSLEDALRVLVETPGTVRILAGGTDLLLDLQQGRHEPVDCLVDITAIPELSRVEITGDHLFIGAAVPLNVVNQSKEVVAHAQALQEASSLVGGPQVRNSATLGGNVAHALPAADGTIALMALGATAEVACFESLRMEPLGNLFRGPGQSTLDAHKDLIIGFHIPLIRDGQASAFCRIMRPQGVALPILNMAIWIERMEDIIADIRIALGPAGPTPQRGITAENYLRGKKPTDEVMQIAADRLRDSVRFRTSPRRATFEYRKHLCGILLSKVLQTAWDRTFQPLKENLGN